MTTPDFSNISKRDVNAKRQVPFTFFELEGEPTLLTRVVGEKNRPLFRRIQQRAGGNNRAKLSQEQLQSKARRNARELFAGADGCIDGWPTPPLDTAGNPVPWSNENCRAFLEALPNHLLDRLIEFVATPENYAGDEDITPDAAEALAGN